MGRVLVISYSVVPGPDRHGVQLVHVLKALASRFSVDVLTLRMGDLGYVERFRDTRMLRVPVPDGGLAEQVEAFRRAIRRQLEGADYDVVHFRDAWSGIPALDKAKSLGAKTVFDVGRTVTESLPGTDALQRELRDAELRCSTEADLVIVPTEAGRTFLAGQGRRERVAVVPPGVDIDLFDYDVTDLRGPPRVMYVGPIGAGRGIRVLLRAMQEVLKETVARLTLVGAIEDGFMGPFSDAVKALELQSHIEVFGPIQNRDMPRVLSAATVCVAPSVVELAEHPLASFPTKILEYMACRRPTVAARRSAAGEVIEENIDGLLFRPGDPKELAQKILRLLTDAPLRQRLSESAHRRVRERYPASATRRRYLQAYLDLLPSHTWRPLGEAARPVTAGRRSEETASDMVGPEAVGESTAVTAPPVEPSEHEGTSEFSAQAAAPAPNAGELTLLDLASSSTQWSVAAVPPSGDEEETSSNSAPTPTPVSEPPRGQIATADSAAGFAFGEIDSGPPAAEEKTGVYRVPEGPKVETSEPVEEISEDMFVAAGDLLAGRKDGEVRRTRESGDRIRALKERARQRAEAARTASGEIRAETRPPPPPPPKRKD